MDLHECVRLLNNKLTEAEKKIKDHSKQLGEVDEQIKTVQEVVEVMKDDVTECKLKCDVLDKRVDDNEKRERKNESYSKKQNVLFMNLVSTKDLKAMSASEQTDYMYNFINDTILANSHYSIPRTDIHACHELGKDDRGPYKPIIMRFAKAEQADKILSNANKCDAINKARQRAAKEGSGNPNPRCITIRQHLDEITTTMFAYLSFAKRMILQHDEQAKCIVRNVGKKQDPVLIYNGKNYSVYDIPTELMNIIRIPYTHDFKTPRGRNNQAGHSGETNRRRRSVAESQDSQDESNSHNNHSPSKQQRRSARNQKKK